MKTMIVCSLLLVAASTHAYGHGGADDAIVVFRASLAPHGNWIHDGYGNQVWQPACVPVGWQPYTVGQWVWTAHGWYWESDEPWGWATYHYGRWDFNPHHGWVWIAGLEWGPAWVEWRHGGGYVGWMPMRPGRSPYAFFSHHNHNRWNFVLTHNMVKRKIQHHLLAEKDRRRAETRTDIGVESGRKNAEYSDSRGPDRRSIEERAGVRIREQRIFKDRSRLAESPVRPDPGVGRSDDREEGRRRSGREPAIRYEGRGSDHGRTE